MEKISCVLVDDNPLALERMEELLKLTEKTQVLATFTSPLSAMQQIHDLSPDIIFLDVEMPGFSGFDIIRKIHEASLFPDFVFVTGYDQYAIKAIKAQAFDYLLKPVDLDELEDCLSRFQNKKNANGPAPFGLSEREYEIMQLVEQGKTSREIGEILFISKHTVDTHRRNILKKIGQKK
jgi:DNA-binding NarL/FixJ family response regulator